MSSEIFYDFEQKEIWPFCVMMSLVNVNVKNRKQKRIGSDSSAFKRKEMVGFYKFLVANKKKTFVKFYNCSSGKFKFRIPPITPSSSTASTYWRGCGSGWISCTCGIVLTPIWERERGTKRNHKKMEDISNEFFDSSRNILNNIRYN